MYPAAGNTYTSDLSRVRANYKTIAQHILTFLLTVMEMGGLITRHWFITGYIWYNITCLFILQNILDITCSPTAVYVSTYDDQQNKGHMYVVDLETMKKDELYFQGRVATGLFYSKRIRVLGKAG